MIGGLLFVLALTLGIYDFAGESSFQQSMAQARDRETALWLIDCLIAAGEAYVAEHPDSDGWIALESLQLPTGVVIPNERKGQITLYSERATQRLYVVIGSPGIPGLAASLQHRYACGVVPVTKGFTPQALELVYRYVGWAQGGKFSLIRALATPGENTSIPFLTEVTLPNSIPESALLVLCTRA